MPISFLVPYKPVDARDPASKSVLIQGALEGHVLVKNENNALPLKSPRLLSVFGYDAALPPGSNGPPAWDGPGASPFQLGSQPQLRFQSFTTSTGVPQFAFNGTMISGGKNLNSHEGGSQRSIVTCTL